MKWFKGKEEGFTLVELLVAIPIIGLLGVAMGAVLIQLLHSDRISQRVLAVRQVQVAGDRVSQDAVQAQSVTFGDDMTDPGWSLELSWSGEWTDENGDYNIRAVDVTYTLVAANGKYELQRHEVSQNSIGSDPDHMDVTPKDITTTVGEHLDASQMSCQWLDTNGDGEANEDDAIFALKVVSVVGTKTEERTYNISPRSLG